MGRQLVLAEKPSVGRELARVLGCRRGGEGYLEGDRYVVTWALGHLVTLADPDDWRDHAALLDYGFAVLAAQTPVYPQNRRIVWKNDCKKFWRAAQASRAAGRRS